MSVICYVFMYPYRTRNSTVFDDLKCLKSFPFENPSEDYLLVKKCKTKLTMRLENFLQVMS